MRRLTIAITLALGVTCGAARADSALVERGACLVNGILTCGNCHSPKGPGGVEIADKAFSGGCSCDEPPFEMARRDEKQGGQLCVA